MASLSRPDPQPAAPCPVSGPLASPFTCSGFLLQYKVWVKPGSEQSFLYGNHVLKSGLGRITENTAQYQGVVVFSMADVPLVSGRHGPCAFWGWGMGTRWEETLSHLLPFIPTQGFGVAAKSTQECRKVDPMAIVVFHQADVGEYVRNEDTLT